ncbi:uncharacterized protein LOC133716213 [Rosa rugosa]|uniref:uncharacterized protein LOC133716213 n=1 Tax=Rosa rugosa TaxID=74645 RepID=UPI002B40F953|nr:uncharacterized protein LOC133716213 [Rosa rugosa]
MQNMFNVLGLSPLSLKAPKFIPVHWDPPPVNWLKVNTDGSFRNPETTGFQGVFRDHEGLFWGAFAHKVEVSSAIDAEVLAVIEALGVAWRKGWTHLWLETDSYLVVHYFTNPKEGNMVADALANYGATNVGARWWDSLPTFIAGHYGKDLSSAVSYRFRYCGSLDLF